MSERLGLDFHHVGLLVNSIDESVRHYSVVFGGDAISEVYTVSSQLVRVCFVRVSPTGFIELVEPISELSKVSRLLKKGGGYYHVAYLVRDVMSTIATLEDLNYKSMEIFSSEAFNGRSCAFLYTPEGNLIELIEHEPGDRS